MRMIHFSKQRCFFLITLLASAFLMLCGLSACALIDGLSSSESASDTDDEDPAAPQERCEAACGSLLADACIPPINCAAACAGFSSGEKSAIIYCEAGRTGCELPSDCQLEPDEPDPLPSTPDVPGCVEVCEDMRFFQCIDDAMHSQCSEICGSASVQSIEDFKNCNEFPCSGSGCFDALRAASG